MFFNRTRIYTVHVKPSIPHAAEKPIFVLEGFNLYGFIFTGLWALYQRLWLQTILLVLTYALLSALVKQHMLGMASAGIIQFAIQVFVGLQANDWIRAKLTRKGYIVADVSVADNLLRAEQRYFERYIAKAG
ncbi:MAG: DUF2628 domain-containing protein [Rickettsiales bacterium]|nr:DUF2628 domain-containing protein [Rickettsiales bacterium]